MPRVCVPEETSEPTMQPKNQTFHVVGITDAQEPELPKAVLRLMEGCRVFSGGKRHHRIVEALLPADSLWIDITVPLDEVFKQYEPHAEVLVFASGDPLFYGFANTIMNRLPQAKVNVFPVFNSLQLLAHRLSMPYHEMHIISLTGRPWKALDVALIEGRSLIGSLTDREKTPAAVAQRLLDYGYTNYRISVGECLGNEQERVGEYSLEEAVGMCFAFPNCLLLKRTEVRSTYFGIPEDRFALLNGRVKMITKMPIRLLSLSLLDLPGKKVLWDVGFCTGSVSIEAKLQFPHLEVVAFEIRPEGEQLMKENAARFGTPGIQALIGDFLTTDLDTLPTPDAVFIGGHGGKLHEVMGRIVPLLSMGGVVVMNAVSAESKATFEDASAVYGLELQTPIRLTVDDHNPIDLLKAVKR